MDLYGSQVELRTKELCRYEISRSVLCLCVKKSNTFNMEITRSYTFTFTHLQLIIVILLNSYSKIDVLDFSTVVYRVTI